METETSDYHRKFIQRIRTNIAELEKVLQNHETELAEALVREEKEENHARVEL